MLIGNSIYIVWEIICYGDEDKHMIIYIMILYMVAINQSFDDFEWDFFIANCCKYF